MTFNSYRRLMSHEETKCSLSENIFAIAMNNRATAQFTIDFGKIFQRNIKIQLAIYN